jgi:uncharacterized protein YjbJ (UPF0337 family)
MSEEEANSRFEKTKGKVREEIGKTKRKTKK